jgi:hypothetical protein
MAAVVSKTFAQTLMGAEECKKAALAFVDKAVEAAKEAAERKLGEKEGLHRNPQGHMKTPTILGMYIPENKSEIFQAATAYMMGRLIDEALEAVMRIADAKNTRHAGGSEQVIIDCNDLIKALTGMAVWGETPSLNGFLARQMGLEFMMGYTPGFCRADTVAFLDEPVDFGAADMTEPRSLPALGKHYSMMKSLNQGLQEWLSSMFGTEFKARITLRGSALTAKAPDCKTPVAFFDRVLELVLTVSLNGAKQAPARGGASAGAGGGR